MKIYFKLYKPDGELEIFPPSIKVAPFFIRITILGISLIIRRNHNWELIGKTKQKLGKLSV